MKLEKVLSPNSSDIRAKQKEGTDDLIYDVLNIGGAHEAARDLLSTQIPLQRAGTRTEIAEAAVFLASPLSSYITGSVLVVDGGEWLTGGRTMASVYEVLQSKL